MLLGYDNLDPVRTLTDSDGTLYQELAAVGSGIFVTMVGMTYIPLHKRVNIRDKQHFDEIFNPPDIPTFILRS